MSLIKRLFFAYRSAASWSTCCLLWWNTLLFSTAIRWPWLYRRLLQNQQSAVYQARWDNKLIQLQMRPQDLPIFYEIFQDQAYQLPVEVVVPINAKVLDIGSHIGLFSHCFCQQHGASIQMIALEPSPTNFALLQANLGNYPNIDLRQKAVTTTTGTAFLQMNGLSYNHRINQLKNGVEVTTISISELLATYTENEKLFLLKMDVEGLESKLVPLLYSKRSVLQHLLIEIHPPYTSRQLKKDLQISASQLRHLQGSTYFINFATDESTSISS